MKMPLWNRTTTGILIAAGLALAIYQFGLKSWRGSWGLAEAPDEKVNWPFPRSNRIPRSREDR